MPESIELVRSILDDNWNRADTNQRKPVIMDITTFEPGRGKRFNLNRSDAIFLYETAHNEEKCSMTSSILESTLLSTYGQCVAGTNSW